MINGVPEGKFQISSTKSQINHKFQYPMTKTLTSVVSHRFAHQSRTAVALGTTADGSLVWNFEFDFWNLFEPALVRILRCISPSVSGAGTGAINASDANSVWARDLGFGAWNLLKFSGPKI